MFGIGMPEMILILAIALIVIGPKKLPDLAKSLGRAMRAFTKATSELKETMQIDNELTEVKKAFDDINEDVKQAVDLKPEFERKSEDKAKLDEAERQQLVVTTNASDNERLIEAQRASQLDIELAAVRVEKDNFEEQLHAASNLKNQLRKEKLNYKRLG